MTKSRLSHCFIRCVWGGASMQTQGNWRVGCYQEIQGWRRLVCSQEIKAQTFCIPWDSEIIKFIYTVAMPANTFTLCFSMTTKIDAHFLWDISGRPSFLRLSENVTCTYDGNL